MYYKQLKKEKMHEMRFRIPENLNIDDLVSQNGYSFYNNKLKKEKLIYICDALVKSRAKNWSKIEKTGSQFAPLSSELLKEVVYDYRKYLDFLLANDIILSDNYWIEGEKCIGYCFNRLYGGQRLKVVIVNNYSLKKARNRSIKRRNEMLKKSTWGYKYLTKWWDSGKLKIDYEAASEWLDEYEKIKINKINMDSVNNKEERIKRAIETTEDLKYLALLINQEKAYYSFSGYGHRFYNPITNLKSELRKFLTYDGQPLIEIDVKNSQPFLIPNLFVPSFWENSRNSGEKLRLKDIDKELNRIINNNNKLKDIVTFLKTPESLDQQEFEFKKITDLVMTAQFYEYIQLHFESLYPERFNNRKNVKKEVMRIFYAENIDVHKPFYKPSKTFQSHFPYVFELLRLIKEIEYTFLPIILQRIESYLLLDVICKKISERDSGILTLTIHDSIITTKGNESIVEEIILHEIESWTGYKPRLEMEDLLPLKMAA